MEEDTDEKDLKGNACFERVFVFIFLGCAWEGETESGFSTRECVGDEVPTLGIEQDSKTEEISQYDYLLVPIAGLHQIFDSIKRFMDFARRFERRDERQVGSVECARGIGGKY